MGRARIVDSKVPRGKAAFHTLLPAAGFLAGGPIGTVIVGATGLAMAVSVLAGPRLSLFGRLFNQLIRPALKIKPGHQEQAAPHIFAEAVGAVFLLSATLLLLIRTEIIGWALALIVVALAALNWLAGICVGCQMYMLIARLRGKPELAEE